MGSMKSPENVDVLIVEDEPLFRQMLEVALGADSQLKIAGSFATAEEVLERLDDLKFDIALLDIQLPGEISGHQLGFKLKSRLPDVGIVLLSSYLEPAYIHSLQRRRQVGWSYLLKSSNIDIATLRRAVKGAARGEIVIDPEILRQLRVRPKSVLTNLTNRELETLALIAEGYSNRAIAERLVVTLKSAENLVSRIFQKLEIETSNVHIQPRVAAVLRYLEETRSK